MKKIMLLALLVLSTQIACLSEHQAIPQNKNPNQDTGPADISDDEDQEDEKNEILSYNKDILPIIKNRCSLCHNEGSNLPFWENYETVFNSKELVKRRVFIVQDMPRFNATEMTLEERDLVATWIDQGALK